jgi:hypothetical protein
MHGKTNFKFKLGRCIALDLGIEVKSEDVEKMIHLVCGPGTYTSGPVLVTVAGGRRRRIKEVYLL